jgi:hypothetical protein
MRKHSSSISNSKLQALSDDAPLLWIFEGIVEQMKRLRTRLQLIFPWVFVGTARRLRLDVLARG